MPVTQSSTIPLEGGAVKIAGSVEATVAEVATVGNVVTGHLADVDNVDEVAHIATLDRITESVKTKLSSTFNAYAGPVTVTTTPGILIPADSSIVTYHVTNRGSSTVLIGASGVSNTGGFLVSLGAGLSANVSGALAAINGVYAVSVGSPSSVYWSKGTN